MEKRKILVIDDDLVWHKLFRRLFGMRYDVHAAFSCAEGVKMAQREQPECILLDFHLQDGDAVSVCSQLGKSGNKMNVPVVVISSDSGAEITAYAECRAAYFVLKGTPAVAELPAIVEKLLLNGSAGFSEKKPRIGSLG
ncbi:MAG: hypothetical protein A2234_03525 [Elusimicrobia bacterium RIFOXYA2_FULL_58_8]|nr:MAG: hypothetical protein A2285_05200 [Elusimicrobia bacterium RIFOXYA12_FULL_57_11]OGS17192.1 MAG: hypothetical protein A2234_03525 [Elusimicrobia bacterium RIFOXYA2_FULL_58_8]